MSSLPNPEHQALTGRIQSDPSVLLHEEVLQPQFTYELSHLLHYYLFIEKVLLVEYERMGLLEREMVTRIGHILHTTTEEDLQPEPGRNMSDIAFAIERNVEEHLGGGIPNWHVDRSRNDLQACAQLMYYREQHLSIIQELSIFARAVHKKAGEQIETIMPGYTHFQAAQVISPGFYLSALSGQSIETLQKLLAMYDESNRCPLGAGAMAGQQLPWDRAQMAQLLGFERVRDHALQAVASREGLLHFASHVAIFCITFSRFITDLQQWGSSEYRFIDLPDDLSGISSAMPQKKNFPILERIRGKTAHVFSSAVDLLALQRNTPYTNLVEVSKESGSSVSVLFTQVHSILRLGTAVMEHLEFRTERMRERSEQEYLGGSTLVNFLALHTGIPYRTAQAIVGQYIVLALEQGIQPTRVDLPLLEHACQKYGYNPKNLGTSEVLQHALEPEFNLYNTQTAGSSHPMMVRQLLAAQAKELDVLDAAQEKRQTAIIQAFQQLDAFVFTGR